MPKDLISLKLHEKSLCFCLCGVLYGKNPYNLSGFQIVSDPKIRNYFHYVSSTSYQIPPELHSFPSVCSSIFLQVTNRKTEVGICKPLSSIPSQGNAYTFLKVGCDTYCFIKWLFIEHCIGEDSSFQVTKPSLAI